ncbi:DNA helicase UvrD [candidate division WOR-3 bacterium]|nr:DNA helicase UvrD [candidate division WOR-3 bacterium]
MNYYADLHIHSKYSRATSKFLDLDNITEAAKRKGINLMGTGDFTNPAWLYELEKHLKVERNGIYQYRGVDFILTTEVCNIFNYNGETKKVHSLIILPNFELVKKFNKEIRRFGSLESDGRPILSINLIDLAGVLFSIEEDAILIPAHLWTPWFGLFGSKSGFDSIEEAFGEYSNKIYAIETGLSSDPPMNWLLSSLDNITLVSNSDAHSPGNIGREANCFDGPIDYQELREILKKQDRERFLYTVEFFPEEGKYHFDGHRKCGIVYSPDESKKHNNICPVCGRPLTLGVLHRVYSLSDRDKPSSEGRIEYKRLIPLSEIVANSLKLGKNAKTTQGVYQKLTTYFGNEFKILLDVSEEDIRKSTDTRTAEAIINVREEKVEIEPGYDGVFGKIRIPEKEKSIKRKQQSLF